MDLAEFRRSEVDARSSRDKLESVNRELDDYIANEPYVVEKVWEKNNKNRMCFGRRYRTWFQRI